jgi:hypothetical protein
MHKSEDPQFDFDDRALLDMDQINRIGSVNLEFLIKGLEVFNLLKINPNNH